MGGRPVLPRPMEGRQAERTRCCVCGDLWVLLRLVDSLFEGGGQNVLLPALCEILEKPAENALAGREQKGNRAIPKFILATFAFIASNLLTAETFQSESAIGKIPIMEADNASPIPLTFTQFTHAQVKTMLR